MFGFAGTVGGGGTFGGVWNWFNSLRIRDFNVQQASKRVVGGADSGHRGTDLEIVGRSTPPRLLDVLPVVDRQAELLTMGVRS